MTESGDDGRQVSDEELVSRARASRASSARHLDQLFGRYHTAIFRRCLAIIGHPDDAEDVTQEVMIRVFRGIDSYQGRSSFRTWLYTIVRNECWSYAERRERQRIPEEVRRQMSLHFDRESHIRVAPVAPEHLHGMFGRMPQSAREIVQLRYLREMPLPSIALLLGMSLSATKMRLYRALSLGQRAMDGVLARSRSMRATPGRRLGDRLDTIR